jgi:hypothetical protein
MKRDMDLVRQLLLEIEEVPARGTYLTTESELAGDDPAVLREHLWLLNDAGFLHGYFAEASAADADDGCEGLTWRGHDFLDAARSESIWQEAKARLTASGVGMTLTVLNALLVSVAKEKLGID